MSEFGLARERKWRENYFIMSTLNFGLLVVDRGINSSPVAIVQLKASGGQEYGHQQFDGLISCECLSARELDVEIDRLKNELEEIRKQGHRRFARAAA